MGKSKIEWCDRTWNAITGCPQPLVSSGCINCYARRTAETRLRGRYGYDAVDPFKITYHQEKFTQPLHWRKNSYVFVNSMGDIFHPDIKVEQLDSIFAVILSCLIFDNMHDHAFMMLTKRPDIMAAYFAPGPEELLARWGKAGDGWLIVGDGDSMWFSEYVEARCTPHPDADKYPRLPRSYTWPLPNVWLGATACTQKELEEKSTVLRSVPAGNLFVSLEPLLEEITLPKDFFGAVWHCKDCGWLDHGGWPYLCKTCGHAYEQMQPCSILDFDTLCPNCGVGAYAGDAVKCPSCKAELGMYEGQQGIAWVICGGETGPGARPMHPAWVRSLRDQCAAFNAPFFFKGWGEFTAVPRPEVKHFTDGSPIPAGAEPVEYRRVGKKRAGRLLDGVEHNARPQLFDHQHRDPVPF